MNLRRPRALSAVLGLAAAIAGGAAGAGESVGRLDFDLPSPGWQLVTTSEHPLRYQSGVDIPLFTKLYALRARGAVPKALLIVTSTSGSARGRTQWVTERCPDPRPNYFAADFDSNKLTRVRECIVVNPGFVAAKYFANADPLLLAMKEAGLSLPASAYSLRVTVGTDGGSFARVHLIAAPSFVGVRQGVVAAPDSFGVATELVAWGEALHAAVKDSMRLGGRLNLPPIEFKDQ